MVVTGIVDMAGVVVAGVIMPVVVPVVVPVAGRSLADAAVAEDAVAVPGGFAPGDSLTTPLTCLPRNEPHTDPSTGLGITA